MAILISAIMILAVNSFGIYNNWFIIPVLSLNIINLSSIISFGVGVGVGGLYIGVGVGVYILYYSKNWLFLPKNFDIWTSSSQNIP